MNNKKLRIGFEAKRVFHNFRGLGSYGRTLLRGLDKYHSNTDYFLYSPAFSDDRSIAWAKKHHRMKVISPKSFLGKTFSSAWRSLFLTSVIEKDNLDIYHGLSHELPPMVSKLNLKTVVTIHDLIFMKRPEFFPWIDRQVYLRKFKYSAHTADAVIAICEQTRQDIIELLGTPKEKVHIVYQSCDPRFYYLKSDDEMNAIKEKYELPEDYILQVGAIVENKNYIGVLKAFNSIKDDVAHSLVFVGRGDESYIAQLESFIKLNHLERRVQILNNVPTPDLPHLYQAAELFVFPSFYEGFGIPIVEALFSKTPVLTTDDGCFHESAGPNSYFVDPSSFQDIAEGMKKILLDRELQKKMIENGREYVEKFHLKRTSKVLHDLYEKLAL